MLRPALFTAFCLLLLIPCSGQAIVNEANRFLHSLDKEQKLETLFPFDTEERYNFHFVPMTRKGITFNEMSATQKDAAISFMKTCLGAKAFAKTQEIMEMENFLKELEKRGPDDHFRDPGNYHISIFGTPAPETVWGWRFEGHHISFNFTVNKQKITAGTPAFLGSNPGEVRSGAGKGKQILRDETDMGYTMLQTLDEEQLKKALIDSVAPKDIITFDKRIAMIDHPAGISYAELDASQRQQLLQLIGIYIHRFTKLFADDRLKEIQKAGLDDLRFAWAGNTKKEAGKGTYYRIQGPTLIIEYDNTQNNANHVHSVLRDLQHDFGGDELLEHYLESHIQ